MQSDGTYFHTVLPLYQVPLTEYYPDIIHPSHKQSGQNLSGQSDEIQYQSSWLSGLHLNQVLFAALFYFLLFPYEMFSHCNSLRSTDLSLDSIHHNQFRLRFHAGHLHALSSAHPVFHHKILS